MVDCYAIERLRVFKNVLLSPAIVLHGGRYENGECYCSTVFSLDGHFKDEKQSQSGDKHISSARAVVDADGSVHMVVYQNRRITKREIVEKSNVNIHSSSFTFSHEDVERSKVSTVQ